MPVPVHVSGPSYREPGTIIRGRAVDAEAACAQRSQVDLCRRGLAENDVGGVRIGPPLVVGTRYSHERVCVRVPVDVPGPSHREARTIARSRPVDTACDVRLRQDIDGTGLPPCGRIACRRGNHHEHDKRCQQQVSARPPLKNHLEPSDRSHVHLALPRAQPRATRIAEGRPGFARVEVEGRKLGRGTTRDLTEAVRRILNLDEDLSEF